MATQYDPAILQQFADALYAQARWVVFKVAALYGFMGFVLSLVAVALLKPADPASTTGLIAIITLAALGAGVSAGRAKAFQLKLTAQQTLCQRQVELNTRSTGQSAFRAGA